MALCAFGEIRKMNRVFALAMMFALLSCPAIFGRDAMQYGLKHLKVLAEDQKVRVVQYAPRKGDKTPMHHHPSMVVYIVKGEGQIHDA
jgi:quercetin dioxygenase-like cupin family protein